MRMAASVWAKTCFVPLAASVSAVAHAQNMAADAPQRIDDIVVTAQKREQSATDVPMSITVASGQTLRDRGIESVDDLVRLVPGLTLQSSAFNSTSFTLRGVGFFNSDLATPPAVTVYLDEAPLPYPAMTKLVAFDLDRVEVLKGPQGTLFGQNATGGAVNYLAAKPSDAVTAGGEVTYGSFNRAQIDGFVSGPLGDRLTARLALQGRWGDPWQESVSRPGDRLGRIDELQARATLEWRPQSGFASRFTFTGTHDGSDSLAGQFIAARTSIPALAAPGLLTFPVVERPRLADWTPNRPDSGAAFPYASDTTLIHVTWRNDVQLASNLSFTALTSYAHFKLAYGQDPDGTPFLITNVVDRNGRVSSFFQEVRLAGVAGSLTWLLGANYDQDIVKDRPLQFFGDVDTSHLFLAIDPSAAGDLLSLPSRMRATTFAIFAHTEMQVTPRLRLEAAVRYNVDRRIFDNCSLAGSERFAKFWNDFRGGRLPLTSVGDCVTIDPANGFQPVNNVHGVLDQDSVSWRAGVSWTPRPAFLVFANASRGYKAGAVPALAASTVAQFRPVPQESVLAFEAGVKASFFDRRAQLNAAAFYYDYRDKQLRGAVLDAAFGPIEALVSIPKSHVEGAEAQLIVRPIKGLTIDASATYVQTRIDRFTGFDALARLADQSGTPFPFSPKWQAAAAVEYARPLTPTLKGFAGAGLTYNSSTFAGVGARDALRIDPFALLDLHAGVEAGGGRFRIWVWGKNVTNTYYWNNVLAYGNAISRFVGEPATFGIGISSRF